MEKINTSFAVNNFPEVNTQPRHNFYLRYTVYAPFCQGFKMRTELITVIADGEGRFLFLQTFIIFSVKRLRHIQIRHLSAKTTHLIHVYQPIGQFT